jgi:hypothetical protein
MSRVHDVWVALNRPPRRGTSRVEFGVLIALFVVWLAVGQFVYAPGSGNTALFVAWAMAPYLPWLAWVIWYRNLHPDEPMPEPPRTAKPLRPGMAHPSEWQQAWLQRQEERRRSRAYVIFWRSMWAVAIAITIVGIYVAEWRIVAAGVFVAAMLGADWWRYFPHDRRRA